MHNLFAKQHSKSIKILKLCMLLHRTEYESEKQLVGHKDPWEYGVGWEKKGINSKQMTEDTLELFPTTFHWKWALANCKWTCLPFQISIKCRCTYNFVCTNVNLKSQTNNFLNVILLLCAPRVTTASLKRYSREPCSGSTVPGCSVLLKKRSEGKKNG